MKLRLSTAQDAARINDIYTAAKSALRKNGINQWQNGYPNLETALNDSALNIGYVLEVNNTIVATAVIDFGIEPSYERIYDGAWRNQQESYGFLHRIAIDTAEKGRGLASLFFAELERQAKERKIFSLRVDTHPDNISMQRALKKYGFIRRGRIYLANCCDVRFAYEKNTDNK